MIGAGARGDRDFLGAARGRDDHRAAPLRHLHEQPSDAACGRVHEHVIARPDRVRIGHEVLRGDRLQHRGTRLCVVDAGRNRDAEARRDRHLFRVAAEIGRLGIAHAHAGREARDVAADGFHDADAFAAGHEGHGALVGAQPRVDVVIVHAGRRLTDQQFARPGDGRVDLGELEHLGTAGAFDSDRFHLIINPDGWAWRRYANAPLRTA